MTSDEITDSWIIILILEGIMLRSKEITTLDIATTKVKAAHITRAVLSCVVTAREEHIPSTWKVMGFLSHIPSLICFLSCFVKMACAMTPSFCRWVGADKLQTTAFLMEPMHLSQLVGAVAVLTRPDR